VKGKRTVCGGILAVLLVAMAVGAGQAQGPESQATMGTSFVYQGVLRSNNNPVSGTCDFQFSLWDLGSGGSQIGATWTETGVTVTHGLFTATLDFGAGVFQGDERYLEIAVRCPSGSGAYTTLTPRQALAPTPYALYAAAAHWANLLGVPAGFADNVDNDTTYTAGAGLTLVGTQFNVVFAGTGAANTVARSDHDHDARYWKLSGNSGTTPGVNYLGTSDNTPLELKVNGLRALRLEPSGISPNLIAGFPGNNVIAGGVGGTVGGGGASGATNRVTDSYGTVSGGANNQAGNGNVNLADATYGTVGGGQGNTASGGWASVGGGSANVVSGTYGTIGGGEGNTASGGWASVGGGSANVVSGTYGTIGGGFHNAAGSVNATVAGGYYNVASNGSATVGGGFSNVASGAAATVAGGQYNIASGAGAFVGGGGSDGSTTSGNRAEGRASTIGGGLGNTVPVTGTYATVGGGSGNTAGSQGATIAGGMHNTASGYNATVAGGAGNSASVADATVGGGYQNSASGEEATVGGGRNNVASVHYATVAGGAENTASGYSSTVGGGYSNTAGGFYAVVGGGTGNTASGNGATIPGGNGALADHLGQWAYANGNFAAVGDAQTSLYVLRNTSVGNAWTDLYLDGVSAQLTIAAGQTVGFEILVVGRSNGGESACYRIQGVVENVAGTTALIGTALVTTLGEDDTAWNAQAIADTREDTLRVQVRGNGETIRWVAMVRTVEVSW